MCSAKSNAKLIDVFGYTLPRYHEGRECYVDFYALDPATGKPRRKKFHLDSVGGKRARRVAADALVEKLTIKLRSGWNPWTTVKTISGSAEITEVLDLYLSHLCKSHRKTSVHTYESKANVLREYIAALANPLNTAGS